MNKAFHALSAITGLIWIIFVFCTPPFMLTRYSLSFFNNYARLVENAEPMTFGAFLFSPFIPMLLSGFCTLLFVFYALAGKSNPALPLFTNVYLFFVLLLHANNLSGERIGVLHSVPFYIIIMAILIAVFGFLQIITVLHDTSLEASLANEEVLNSNETQKLLNQAIRKPVNMSDEQAPRGLNPEIPKLAEGTQRKQRIATKIAFTETPQKSAEDDILL